MNEYIGCLRKMAVKDADPIEYTLVVGEERVFMNPLIGKKISLSFTGKIECVACKRMIKKSYQRGYCYPCTKKLAQCDFCILKPELCHFHKGTCREPEWAKEHCMVPHIVYLANSSGLKVGITRETQIPTRWIDQGAIQAVPILRVQSRYQSGLLEVILAKSLSDKTNWRKMLKGEVVSLDLEEKRSNILPEVSQDIQKIASKFTFGDIEILTAEQVKTFRFPVEFYPKTIKSLSFDKTSVIDGIIQGIKGQYLIFDVGVINIRNFAGYEVSLSGVSGH